jgi:general secretion pathway protein H
MKFKNQDGFTLVEMLVVMAILAATMVVSLPYVRGSNEVRALEASAQILASLLRETQSAAVANNAERVLSVDLRRAKIINPSFSFPLGTVLQIETAESQISTDHASIRFFADGGSTGGKITLANGRAKFELAMNWLTGAVVVTRALAQ